jgi:carbon storage regulator CsrA
MLVLTRKLGESIVISDDIVIKVTAIQGSRVKIAVEAPQSRRIMRGEIAGSQTNSPAPVRDESNWSCTGTDGARVCVTTPAPTHAK